MGITRNALRYYEKIGLSETKRQIENLYREFDFNDISNFMTIDFHKKRGFALVEIKNQMKQSKNADISVCLEQKAIELQQNIYNQQCMLNCLNETKKFFKCACDMKGKFEIRDFPLFSVLKSFDNPRDISNYGDTVFNALDGEDLVSNLIRAISFDNISYIGSKTCIVKKISGEQKIGKICKGSF